MSSVRAALKVMHPVSVSEVGIGGMAAKMEPSLQYPSTPDCCMTDGSREVG